MAQVKGEPYTPPYKGRQMPPRKWHIRLNSRFDQDAARRLGYDGWESEYRETMETLCDEINELAMLLQRQHQHARNYAFGVGRNYEFHYEGQPHHEEHFHVVAPTVSDRLIVLGKVMGAVVVRAFASWKLEKWGLTLFRRRRPSFQTDLITSFTTTTVYVVLEEPDQDRLERHAEISTMVSLTLLGVGYAVHRLLLRRGTR